jgi:hypothetical protein
MSYYSDKIPKKMQLKPRERPKKWQRSRTGLKRGPQADSQRDEGITACSLTTISKFLFNNLLDSMCSEEEISTQGLSEHCGR